MQPPILVFQDHQQRLSMSLFTYNPFQSAGVDGQGAFFSVPTGTYAFEPLVRQTTPGNFKISFSGAGQFTGSNFQRAATLDLSGTADENTGAADLTLRADGSVFHIVVAGADISGAVALSERIARDIQAKNWSDVYLTFTPSLKESGYSEVWLAKEMATLYRHVTSACRIGPAYDLRDHSPVPLDDNLTDVLAITLSPQSGPPIATFATIDLVLENGSWVFVQGNPLGTSPGATGPKDFGIPAPSP